jgi:hypothetical protein
MHYTCERKMAKRNLLLKESPDESDIRLIAITVTTCYEGV